MKPASVIRIKSPALGKRAWCDTTSHFLEKIARRSSSYKAPERYQEDGKPRTGFPQSPFDTSSRVPPPLPQENQPLMVGATSVCNEDIGKAKLYSAVVSRSNVVLA